MKYSIESSDGTVLFYYKTKLMEEGYKDNIHCYDEMKFVRIKSGAGIWSIGGKKYSVSSGDVLLMSRLDIRTVSKISQAPFIIEQIGFLPAFLSCFNNITDFFIKRRSDFSNLLPEDFEVTDKMTEIIDEIKENSLFIEQAIKAKLSELVILTARLTNFTSDSISKDKRMDTVLKAMEYIKENYFDELSLGSVSSRYYLSSSYFSRLFKQYAGMTFNEYVASIRVNAVIQLLNNGHTNILDAAMQCGFCSSSGFYKTFRHVTGLTPKIYKQ